MDASTLGSRLATARLASGLSQMKLASLMQAEGCSTFHQTTVSRLENGTRPLLFDEAVALARIFDVGLDWFAGDDDARGPDTESLYREFNRLKGDVIKAVAVLRPYIQV